MKLFLVVITFIILFIYFNFKMYKNMEYIQIKYPLYIIYYKIIK